MNQLLTLVIVVAVFLIIILAGRKDRVGKADAAKESDKKERDEWERIIINILDNAVVKKSACPLII